MELSNATYEELIDEIGKRAEWSPNQIARGVPYGIMSISQKRAIVNNSYDMRMLINSFRKDKDSERLSDFSSWLLELIETLEEEISEIETTL